MRIFLRVHISLTNTHAHRNKALLSFGADAEEPEDGSLPKTKFKSAHDVLHDSRLSSQVIDDRGVSATLPPELMAGPPMPDREEKGKRQRAEDDSDRRRDGVRRLAGGRPSLGTFADLIDDDSQKRGRLEAEPSGSAKLDEARKLKEKAPKSEACVPFNSCLLESKLTFSRHTANVGRRKLPKCKRSSSALDCVFPSRRLLITRLAGK